MGHSWNGQLWGGKTMRGEGWLKDVGWWGHALEGTSWTLPVVCASFHQDMSSFRLSFRLPHSPAVLMFPSAPQQQIKLPLVWTFVIMSQMNEWFFSYVDFLRCLSGDEMLIHTNKQRPFLQKGHFPVQEKQDTTRLQGILPWRDDFELVLWEAIQETIFKLDAYKETLSY